MIPVLALDPGLTGAAVLLSPDGKTVLCVWRWIQRKRVGGTVYVVTGRWVGVTGRRGVVEDGGELSTLHGVGEHIREIAAMASPGRYLCVVEGLFIPRRRKGENPKAFGGRVASTLTLAEATALVYGPLLPGSTALLRPKSSVWRPAILGLRPNVSSDIAERTAIALVRATMTGLGDLGADPHVAEAAVMSRWGWVQQQQAALSGGA